MPRRQERELSRHLQVDPRDTFDVTTPNLQVTVQHPTDPYVNPGDKTASLRKLAEALAPVSEGVADWANYQNKKEWQQGQDAFFRGDGKPSAGMLKIKAYETLQGRAAARNDYRRAVMDYVNENAAKKIAPDEYDAGLEQIARQFIEGKSDDFLRGFAEDALQIEETGRVSYSTAQQQMMEDENIENMNQTITDSVGANFQDALAELGITSIEDSLGNTHLYTQMETGVFKMGLGQAMRDDLTKLQENGAGLNMDKPTISEAYLKRAGLEAVKYGVPELLEFAYIPDESGNSVANGGLGELVERYYDAASNARNTYMKAKADAEDEAWQQRAEAVTKTMYQKVAVLDTIRNPLERAQEAQLLYQEVMENPELVEYLDKSDLKYILSAATDAIGNEYAWPDTSVDDVFVDLYTQASAGDLTLQQLHQYRAAGVLSRSDYLTVFNKLDTWEKKRAATDLGTWTHKGTIDKLRESYIDVMVPKLPQPDGSFTWDPVVTAAIRTAFADLEEQWIQENSRYPGINEWMNEIASVGVTSFGWTLKDLKSGTRPEPVDSTGTGIPGFDTSMNTDEVRTTKPQEEWSWWDRLRFGAAQRPGHAVSEADKAQATGSIEQKYTTRTEKPKYTLTNEAALKSYWDLLFNPESNVDPETGKGYSREDIRKWLQENNETPEGARYFESLFVNSFLFQTIFGLPGGAMSDEFTGDLWDNMRDAKKLLTDKGFSPDEIDEAARQVIGLFFRPGQTTPQ